MHNPSFLPGSRTNRQDSRFAKLCCPKGEEQGCSDCIQSQGRETRICQSCLIRHLCTDKLPSMALDSGSPCRNDGVLAIMRIAAIFVRVLEELVWGLTIHELVAETLEP